MKMKESQMILTEQIRSQTELDLFFRSNTFDKHFFVHIFKTRVKICEIMLILMLINFKQTT